MPPSTTILSVPLLKVNVLPVVSRWHSSMIFTGAPVIDVGLVGGRVDHLRALGLAVLFAQRHVLERLGAFQLVAGRLQVELDARPPSCRRPARSCARRSCRSAADRRRRIFISFAVAIEWTRCFFLSLSTWSSTVVVVTLPTRLRLPALLSMTIVSPLIDVSPWKSARRPGVGALRRRRRRSRAASPTHDHRLILLEHRRHLDVVAGLACAGFDAGLSSLLTLPAALSFGSGQRHVDRAVASTAICSG